MSVVQDLLQQIEKGINHAQLNEDFTKKGEILELKDGVATVIGLDTVMFSEIVLFENCIVFKRNNKRPHFGTDENCT